MSLVLLLDKQGCVTAHTNYDVSEYGWKSVVHLKEPEIWGKQGHSMLIVSELPNNAYDTFCFGHNKPWHLYHDALIKSTLQKAVRRRWTLVALRMAWQLIRQNFTEFIRKLISIIVEDAIIHEEMLGIVWLMAAVSKGWSVSYDQVLMLLSVVRDIAECAYRDVVPKGSRWTFKHVDDTQTTVTGSSICLALLVSASYRGSHSRGMGPDEIARMKSMAQLWTERASRPEWIRFLHDEAYAAAGKHFSQFSRITRELLCSSVLEIREEDRTPIGIDFTCFDNDFCKNVRKSTLSLHDVPLLQQWKLNDECIKKAIWYYRSSVYTKLYRCTEEDPLTLLSNDLDIQPWNERRRYKDTWNWIKGSVNQISETYWKPLEDPPRPAKRKFTQQQHDPRQHNIDHFLLKQSHKFPSG